jgi:GMP synthase (glutamine-hydrolysing)
METLSIIDCSISSPSNGCLNKLVERTKVPFTYHLPALTNTRTYKKDSNAKTYFLFGSHSSVNEERPWQRHLSHFISEKLHQGIPVLGLCFGHQLLAKAFGGTIGKSDIPPFEHKGVREWEIIEQDSRWNFFKGKTFHTFVYHNEEIKKLPQSFYHLGQSPKCKYEVVSHRELPYLGIQGHPEASQYFVDKELEMKDQIPEKLVTKAFKDGDWVLDTFLETAGFFFDNLTK